jgi:hypothetical protein
MKTYRGIISNGERTVEVWTSRGCDGPLVNYRGAESCGFSWGNESLETHDLAFSICMDLLKDADVASLAEPMVVKILSDRASHRDFLLSDETIHRAIREEEKHVRAS